MSATLRRTSHESLEDLRNISDETGGTQRFEKIEKFSSKKAEEAGIEFSEGRDEYFKSLYNEG